MIISECSAPKLEFTYGSGEITLTGASSIELGLDVTGFQSKTLIVH